MRISINTSKWYDDMWAAFIFFTRLPFWRWHQPPKESYRAVVEYWPLTGWLTGGAMAGTLYAGSLWMPYPMAVILAIAVRILLTGALHEDGLADFLDGFGGGGRDRQRILDIMKDSRIGTYGVLGLVLYILLLVSTLYSIPPKLAALTVFAGDAYAKMVASQTIQLIPYARNEHQSKAQNIYRKFGPKAGISLFLQGMLPLVGYLWYFDWQLRWDLLIFVPCIVMYALYLLIWNRLKGYTGDCCGAIFLLIELSFYIVAAARFAA